MILITGDLHGEHDIQKFSVSCFPLQKQLSRKDYVIICGDFGLVWRDFGRTSMAKMVRRQAVDNAMD